MVSTSQGKIVRKSMSSQEMSSFSFAICATSRSTWTCVPQPTIVISEPKVTLHSMYIASYVDIKINIRRLNYLPKRLQPLIEAVRNLQRVHFQLYQKVKSMKFCYRTWLFGCLFIFIMIAIDLNAHNEESPSSGTVNWESLYSFNGFNSVSCRQPVKHFCYVWTSLLETSR